MITLVLGLMQVYDARKNKKISDSDKSVFYRQGKRNIYFLGGVSEQNVSLTFDQPKDCCKIYLY